MASARVLNRRPNTQDGKPSRREFLYYVWGASMLLLLTGVAVGSIWFMLPASITHPDYIITIDPHDIPAIGSPSVRTYQFFLAHTDDDALVALNEDAPGQDGLVNWVVTNRRFESRSLGSKFELDGTYIEGPAPRSMDRYRMTITLADGTTAITNDAGDPIPLNGREIASVIVDTRQLIQRAGRV